MLRLAKAVVQRKTIVRSLREQGLGTSALATVGAVTGFVSNDSLEEKDRESAAYSGGAGEVVHDIGAAGPKGLRCAIDDEVEVHSERKY